MILKLTTAFLRYHMLILTGQVKIISPAGQKTSQSDPKNFGETTLNKPFLIVETLGSGKSPTARLEVTFRVSQITKFNRYIIPYASIPFFAGAPGFLSKSFYFNPEDQSYSGIYEWTDRNSVEKYLDTYATRFMTGLSIPGSLKYRIIPILEIPQSSPQIQTIARQ